MNGSSGCVVIDVLALLWLLLNTALILGTGVQCSFSHGYHHSFGGGGGGGGGSGGTIIIVEDAKGDYIH